MTLIIAPAAVLGPGGLFHAREMQMLGRIADLLVAVMRLIAGLRPAPSIVIPAEAGIQAEFGQGGAAGETVWIDLRSSSAPAFAGMTSKNGHGALPAPLPAWSDMARQIQQNLKRIPFRGDIETGFSEGNRSFYVICPTKFVGLATPLKGVRAPATGLFFLLSKNVYFRREFAPRQRQTNRRGCA